MTYEPVVYREISVDGSTQARARMDEIADRIIARDKRYHTGGSGMVMRIVDVHGKLRHPFRRKGK